MLRFGCLIARFGAAMWLGATIVGLADCGGDCEETAQTGLLVGSAKRDITPTEATAPPDGQVFRGGYGLGPVRRSTGVLASITFPMLWRIACMPCRFFFRAAA